MRIHKWMLFGLDMVLATAAPYVALFARYDYQPAADKLINILPYTALTLPVFALCYCVFGIHRLPWRHFSPSDLSRLALALGVSIAITLLISVFAGMIHRLPRSVPPLQFAFAIVAFSFFRLSARVRHKHARRTEVAPVPADSEKRHYLVVGLNSMAQAYLQLVEALAPNAARVEGILDERPHALGRKLNGVAVLGRPQAVGEVLSALTVHCIDVTRIIIAVPFASLSKEAQLALLEVEKTKGIEIDMFVDRLGFDQDNLKALERHKSNETATIQAAQSSALAYGVSPLNPTYLRIKRVLDCVAAAALLVLLAPLFLIAGVLVASNIGFPLLFWQQRPGLGGRQFRLYKFRTMGPGHDRNGKLLTDAERLSRAGRFLRRSRLDELPQLYNILIGEMSFVGPRPLMAVFQPRNGHIRYSARPGITGWAQIHGGDELTADEKLALDVQYLKTASIWLDLKIIFRTVAIAITGDKVDRATIDQALAETSMLIDTPCEANDAGVEAADEETPRDPPVASWRPVREVDVRRAS
ncbi:MAG: sugar transferase [Hyphomicrobiaceae bacterium]